MKQSTQNNMKRVNINVDQMQVFVLINSAGMKINADVNVKNEFMREFLIKDLFGILVIVSGNVINHVMLMSIQITKILSAEKNQLINWSKNVPKMLKR